MEGSPWLIGPQFYFSFISALKIGASVLTVFYLVLAVITAMATGDYWSSFLRMLMAIPQSLLWLSACILGVFVVLEKSGERATWLDSWSTKDLRNQQSHSEISKGETFFELGVSAIGLLWVTNIISLPVLIQHDGAWVTTWSASLPEWFWWLAGIMLAFDLAFCLLKLIQPFWSQSLKLTTIVTNILWIVVLSWVVTQPQLLLVDESHSVEVTKLLPLINNLVDGVLLFSCVILAWDTIVHAWRFFRIKQ